MAIYSMCNSNVVTSDLSVYSCGQIVINPDSSIVVSARVSPNKDFTSGVLQPVASLPGGLALPHAAVDIDGKNHRVHVQLVNQTSRTLVIPKRQKIAEVHQASVISDQFKHVEMTASAQEPKSDIPVDLDEDLLNEQQKSKIQEVLQQYSDVFAFSSTELGNAKETKHQIKLTDNTPFKDRARRIPPAMYEEVKNHLEEMLACGAIRHSNSPWSSNVVLVRKKDGRLRLCLDFRKLNSRTIRDAYQLPRIEETLDNLSGSTWFSSLDLQSGYWQVEMDPLDRPKTAFSVGNLGFFECNRMPFGLTNAPATFQRLMERTLKDLPNCLCYLDDIIIHAASFEEHIERLAAVLERLRNVGLKSNLLSAAFSGNVPSILDMSSQKMALKQILRRRIQ